MAARVITLAALVVALAALIVVLPALLIALGVAGRSIYVSSAAQQAVQANAAAAQKHDRRNDDGQQRTSPAGSALSSGSSIPLLRIPSDRSAAARRCRTVSAGRFGATPAAAVGRGASHRAGVQPAAPFFDFFSGAGNMRIAPLWSVIHSVPSRYPASGCTPFTGVTQDPYSNVITRFCSNCNVRAFNASFSPNVCLFS